MKRCIFYLLVVALSMVSCQGQSNESKPKTPAPSTQKKVGGGCDGCELMFIDMPAELNAVDTCAGWNETGVKLLVTGKVYQMDGKTPAKDVVIYYWQTDNNGYYSPRTGNKQKTQRHGHLRGWLKTDQDGNYTIYTIRPAPYPNETIPAHIHFSIKEPNIDNEFYIDDIEFDDDPLLTKEIRTKRENRGGSGIVKLKKENGLMVAQRDIILGSNIPDYPKEK